MSPKNDATRILVIVKGRIIEEGTREELMRRKSYYWRLHRSQHQSIQVG